MVDESVIRILTPMFAVGLFDDVNNNTLDNNVLSEDHNRFARTLSSASHVLLKNDDSTLPLKKSKSKIAIFGKSALEPVVAGGGSGAVTPPYVISPLMGIANALGISIPDSNAFSCNTTKLIKNARIKQFGCLSGPGASPEDCCSKCGKLSSCHTFSYEDGKCGFYPNSNELKFEGGGVVGECVKPVPSSEWRCNDAGVCIAYHDGQDLESATALALEADYNIVAISQFAKEGSDRENLSFDVTKTSQTCQVVPMHQNELVATIASTDKTTIVTISAPGAVLLPWKDDVDAIVIGFMPGQEYGNALADVVFGDVNPSAKLTLTIPNKENEINFSAIQYPGILNEEVYLERSLIDYRWYTSKGVTPAYPFGHGLSYTSFEYSQMTIDKAIDSRKVTITIKNIGNVVGCEVVQLYIQFPKETMSPPLQLKGFHKTRPLQPADEERLILTLTSKELSIWDVAKQSFRVVPGTYTISVGASSADIRLSAAIQVL